MACRAKVSITPRCQLVKFGIERQDSFLEENKFLDGFIVIADTRAGQEGKMGRRREEKKDEQEGERAQA